MRRKNYLLFMLFLLIAGGKSFTEDNYLKIKTVIDPKRIKQGESGVLKIKIEPSSLIQISSYPELKIKLTDNKNLHFSKVFFNSSELGFKTIKMNNFIFLEMDKEIPIEFKVKEDSPVGKITIDGEVIFIAVFKDNWSLKTYQKFSISFSSRKNYNLKKTKNI